MGGNYEEKSSTHTMLDRAVTLKIACNIKSLHNIDTTQQSFSAAFVLHIQLNDVGQLNEDGSVKRDGPLLSDGSEITADNWDPRIELENVIELKQPWVSHRRTFMSTIMEEDSDGTKKEVEIKNVQYKFSNLGSFVEKFQLHYFPFDRQCLSIRVTSRRPYMKKITNATGGSDGKKYTGVLRLMPPHDRPLGMINAVGFPLANVHQIDSPFLVATPTTTPMSTSCSRTVMPKLKATVVLRRIGRYYVVTAMLPMFLVTTVCMSTFFMSRDELGDRLQISITAILAAIVFKQTVQGDLPNLGYLTLLDQYMIMCESFLYVVTLQNVIGNQREEQIGTLSIDSLLAWGIAALWLIAHIIFFVVSYIYVYKSAKTSAEQYVRDERKWREYKAGSLFTRFTNLIKIQNFDIRRAYKDKDKRALQYHTEGDYTYDGLGPTDTPAYDEQVFVPWNKHPSDHLPDEDVLAVPVTTIVNKETKFTQQYGI
eukprot:m.140112 g.140112  ORF g.140112 m.140112 type:complete len:482 (+) comp17651_c0_seq1:184-1629(+)